MSSGARIHQQRVDARVPPSGPEPKALAQGGLQFVRAGHINRPRRLPLVDRLEDRWHALAGKRSLPGGTPVNLRVKNGRTTPLHIRR